MPNLTKCYFYSSGQKRSYLMYVPAAIQPKTPVPLVLSFHGYAEWPAHQMDISHWNQYADENGFIVVYPSGTGFPRHWKTSGLTDAAHDSSAEVRFITDLIDRLSRQFTLDPARLFANGLSNGGGMSLLLACRLADRIAAIGSVSGAYLYPLEQAQFPRPVPLIAFHGTGDPIVPFHGGRSFLFNYPFPVVPDWIKSYALLNGCTGEPESLSAVGEVKGIRYSGSDPHSEVIFYTIEGGGHTWPGGGAIPEIIAGRNTQTIDATRLIWDFFVRHPLPLPVLDR